MATTPDFINYVTEQISGIGAVRYQKMFGEYIVYVDNLPIILVCDNTAFVKPLDGIADKMIDAEKKIPYKGAKEQYVLDIDDCMKSREIVSLLLKITPIPKKKKK